MPSKRVVVWERVDAAVSEALLTAGGQARRAVQSMIDLAVQPGSGGSDASRATSIGVRVRSDADEAAPTASNWGPRPSGYPVVIAVGAAPAPADAAPRDLLWSNVIGTSLDATTTFAQADGSAWPAPWTIERVPVGGGATVKSGMGVITTGQVGGYAAADYVAARRGEPSQDCDVLLTFRLDSTDVWPRLMLRSNTANLDPTDAGIVVGLYPTGLKLETVTNGTVTTVSAAAKTHTVASLWRARVKVSGNTVQARTWSLAVQEPAAWDIASAVTITAPGYGGIAVGGGNAAAAQTCAVDDIAWASGAAGYGSAYGASYGL